MMESCLNKADRQEQVGADDLKGADGTLPASQHSCIEETQHLQVYLRVRPFTAAETSGGESQDCVTIEAPDTVLLKPPSLTLSARLSADRPLPQTGQRFQFSQVYGPETTQRELFAGTVKDLVKGVLEGGNSLVFTYGVTNAGKTFTFLGPDSDAGIVPRSLDVIFSSIGERVFPVTSIKPHRCREVTRLTAEQQVVEVSFKQNLLRQLKESEKSNVSLLNSTNRTFLEGSSMLWTSAEDKISLEVEAHTKFSVWVSFCEIYNENIHDLLKVAPSGARRRKALHLSQDFKGNAFVKDLHWIQVNSAEEAYRVMKVGKKNQSFSSTRLNQLSSRSHSIFSIRILRFEDIGTPRVQTVSELCLCDLAGSERCAKTQNKGERLKEAGNINTSLLILGKCLNALRLNQQARLLQHVPFRESKLTHYLQSFFCGRGKACMIVNINQCASMYDETLNVLKFSAVAQKVVVLSSRPLPFMPQRSVGEVSFISNAESKALQSSGMSSLMSFESSLEDVQEAEEEQSLMTDTMNQTEAEDDCDANEVKILVCKKTHQRQAELLKQLQVQLKTTRAESLLMESRVREETSREFSELFSQMQNDYCERLAREREILEERSEKRLEIFKNLLKKMSAAGRSQDAAATAKCLHSCFSELAGTKKFPEAACTSLGQDRAGPLADRSELNEQQENAPEPLAHKYDARGNEDEEKRTLLFELQKKSTEVSRLEKQVADLQRMAELAEGRSSRERAQLQEALTALKMELRAREDALSALECQTLGKVEEERKTKDEAIAALVALKRSEEKMLESLAEERKDKKKAMTALKAEKKTKDEVIAALVKLKQGEEKMLESLAEERKDKQKAMAALEAERRATEEAVAALAEEKRGREEALAALSEEKRCREEAERKEMKRREEGDALRQQVRDMTVKLEAAEHQVTSNTERAEQAFMHLQAAQAQLDEQAKVIEEKSSQIFPDLPEQVSELQKSLAEESPINESKHGEVLELKHELTEVKQQLAHKQLILDQQLNQKEAASKQEVEELKKKIVAQEEMWMDELRSQLERQKQASKEELEDLRGKLKQQTEASERQTEHLKERLRDQEASSLQQLEELKRRLSEQKAASSKLQDDLKQKLGEQARTAEQLRTELEEAARAHSEAEDLKRLDSDLQTEVASLREEVSNMEKAKESSCKTKAQLEKKDSEMEEKLAELQKELLEKAAQVTSLKKSLQEAQERREEDELQAVQEARHREVERRRELLAVAHEAIAQKDEEISRLKEDAKQDSEKLKSLNMDLQRKEDDSSDLREKLADYKKQIQQVQKEISAMREEEKVLRQKLCDVEKTKKQLQCDVASRDRTIQQLRVEQSSNANCDQRAQLYQQACKELEAKERVMEGMRLALSEQEDTQEQMEQALEEKLNFIQELSSEVEKLKQLLLQQESGNTHHQVSNSQSDDFKLAKEEAAQAQESLKISAEKHQAERKKWMEEKLSLIGQAKEAEDKRNREMRKFAEDRDRCTRLQSQLESQLAEKEQTMKKWRTERDTLVAALEIQLTKLLSSQAEKDKLIQQLQQNDKQLPQESADDGPGVVELQAALCEKEAEILRLEEQLKASAAKQDTVTQTDNKQSSAALMENPRSEATVRASGGTDTRASVSSQGSTGCPSVLESSEISTEEGRMSRFPRPELEISFSPLQPNRMALRRQGEEGAVTVKITRSARKRKSSEMEKEEVEAENRRNTRTKLTPKLTPHREESSSPAGHQDSQISIRSKKEGMLQKIGEFLQRSPTVLGTKAKKMMSLVNGQTDADAAASSSSPSLAVKKNKKRPYRPEISSPMDMPSHPIISTELEEKESDHHIIKRRLRSRMDK